MVYANNEQRICTANCYAPEEDKATDIHKDAHLTAYVCFSDDSKLHRELHFLSQYLKPQMMEESVFGVTDSFLQNNRGRYYLVMANVQMEPMQCREPVQSYE